MHLNEEEGCFPISGHVAVTMSGKSLEEFRQKVPNPCSDDGPCRHIKEFELESSCSLGEGRRARWSCG